MKVKWLPVSLIILPYPCLAVTAWLFAWQGTLDGSLLPLAALAGAAAVVIGILCKNRIRY